MKLSRRTTIFLFPPTVALCMSGMMSFALTLINQGVDRNFVRRWLFSFGISFVVAVPISMFVVPRIQKFYDRISRTSEIE